MNSRAQIANSGEINGTLAGISEAANGAARNKPVDCPGSALKWDLGLSIPLCKVWTDAASMLSIEPGEKTVLEQSHVTKSPGGKGPECDAGDD